MVFNCLLLAVFSDAIYHVPCGATLILEQNFQNVSLGLSLLCRSACHFEKHLNSTPAFKNPGISSIKPLRVWFAWKNVKMGQPCSVSAVVPSSLVLLLSITRPHLHPLYNLPAWSQEPSESSPQVYAFTLHSSKINA